MNLRTLLALTLFAGLATPTIADEVKPLRVLVVAGGCCHDYANQKEILKKGIEARLNAKVEMAYDATKGTKPVFEIYKKDGWYKDFDVVVHDECAADITDPTYVENILKAHREGAGPKLEAEIRAFVRQEINHTREHIAFNRAAVDAGYDLDAIDRRVAENLVAHRDAAIATAACRIRDVRDMANPNVVKVVTALDGRALYFSRSPLPYFRNAVPGLAVLRHKGIYA